MKKLLSLLTAALMLSAVTACGSDEESSGSSSSSSAAKTSEAADTTSSEASTAESTTEAIIVSTLEKTTESETKTTEPETTEPESSEPETEEADFDQENAKYLAIRYFGTRNNIYPEFCDIDFKQNGDAMLLLYSLFDGHTNLYANYTVDTKTLKGTDSLGNPVDLNDPPAEMWQPDVPERAEMRDKGAFCGIAYVDALYPEFIEYTGTNVMFREIFLQSGILDKFNFVASIPESNYAQTKLGSELYLIIPRDPEARVTVTQYDFENDRELGSIYSSYDGSPFLLKCNYSDISSDIKIKIVDNEGEHEIFSPYISMMDGSATATSDKVMVFTYERPELH